MNMEKLETAIKMKAEIKKLRLNYERIQKLITNGGTYEGITARYDYGSGSAILFTGSRETDLLKLASILAAEEIRILEQEFAEL